MSSCLISYVNFHRAPALAHHFIICVFRYDAFDFHKECSKMRWHRLSILINRLFPKLEEFGYDYEAASILLIALVGAIYRKFDHTPVILWSGFISFPSVLLFVDSHCKLFLCDEIFLSKRSLIKNGHTD